MTEPMNIFIEADSIATDRVSGIGHATLEIIRSIERLVQINRANIKLTLIVPFGKKRLLSRYRFINIRVRTLPPGFKYVNFLLTRTSIPVPVDIWFGRGIYIFPNYKVWYTPFSESLMFLHDVSYKIHPQTTHPKNLTYMQLNMSRWLNRATKVLAISKSSADEILHYFPMIKNKLELVYLGVDSGFYYRRSSKEIESVKLKYLIDGKYFLYVGNIEPRKNILNLVNAYKIYCDKHKSEANLEKLVLVGGGGWNDQDIRTRIDELQKEGYNIIKPDKYVVDEDLPALYSGSVSLVHLSIHEGYGLSLAQAQACGSRIIASDLPVFRETLSPTGVIYVPINGMDETIAAMERVSADKKVIKGHVEHTWDSTAKLLLTIAGIIRD